MILKLDTRPRCKASKVHPDYGNVPCDLHRGHTGNHEWQGTYMGRGGITWRGVKGSGRKG